MSAHLITLVSLLTAGFQVNALDEAARMCFFAEPHGQAAKFALCCDGRGQAGECCGMSNAHWCKDISAEETGIDMHISFYKDDEGIDLLTDGLSTDHGDFHGRYLSDHYTNPPGSRPNLNQCSVRFIRPLDDPAEDESVPATPNSPDPGSYGLWGRMADEPLKCWEPDHVKWMDSSGDVWWGHIVAGKLEEVMERLQEDNVQSLEERTGRDDDPLLDAVCEFKHGAGGVLDAPQDEEQYSDSSSESESE